MNCYEKEWYRVDYNYVVGFGNSHLLAQDNDSASNTLLTIDSLKKNNENNQRIIDSFQNLSQMQYVGIASKDLNKFQKLGVKHMNDYISTLKVANMHGGFGKYK